ncbi:PspC domain-containing protein [Anaerosphaera multitolerans]|uniref:PspC domain-containing protein n=1 Tax=Anaerosphaera multitolerans TaxID=2487351 RepID=A0A437S5P6_9FIRM|nr:PspC domain-containing protein [Anaerosphaera multitolerans]RVU54236.1 PspC domain-containing protein [Anaerosphaera multitolerans]
MKQKLYRSSRDCKIAGVCGGVAEFFDIDSSIVRIIWLFATLVAFSGAILYLVCWLILPWDYEIDIY